MFIFYVPANLCSTKLNYFISNVYMQFYFLFNLYYTCRKIKQAYNIMKFQSIICQNTWFLLELKKKKEKVVSALNLKALLYRHYTNTLYLRLFGL